MTFLATLMIKSARRETSDINSIVGNEKRRAAVCVWKPATGSPPRQHQRVSHARGRLGRPARTVLARNGREPKPTLLTQKQHERANQRKHAHTDSEAIRLEQNVVVDQHDAERGRQHDGERN
jgi:hypothetical protein